MILAQKLRDRFSVFKYLFVLPGLLLFFIQNEIVFSQTPELLRFLAIAGDEQAEIIWETKNETNLAGFILLRCEGDSTGDFLNIATYLIDSALVAKNPVGNFSYRYSWMDVGLINGQQYWYKLRIVAQDNVQWEHGPIAVIPADGSVIFQAAESLSWEWQNPLPSGNILRDIDFVDDAHGWIVGERNTILRTSDGGKSWKFLNSGIKLPTTAGAFAQINFGMVQFINRFEGFVAGHIYSAIGDSMGRSIILKTNDGGETWQLSFIRTYPWIGSSTPTIFFLDDNYGWASVCSAGIFRTIDSGNSWLVWGSHPPMFELDNVWISVPQFNHLFFTAPDSGWGYPVYRSLFQTTDGGRSWIRTDFPVGDEYDLYFINNFDGWLIDVLGKLYRTIDGGKTWSLRHTFNEAYFPYMIRFKNENVGVILGKDALFKTSDGGNSWTSLTIGFNHLATELECTGEKTFWMLSANDFVPSIFDRVHCSKDGGLSWQSLYQGIPGDFFDVEFLNLEKGWVLGNDWNPQLGENKGLILTTTNGGRNWEIQATVTDFLVAIDMVDDHQGWAAAGRYNGDLQRYEGAIFHTHNDWQTWQKIEMDNRQLFDIFALDTLHAWACGSHGILLSTKDGGETWHRGHFVSPDSSRIFILHLFFINEKLGWATSTQSSSGYSPWYGALFHTQDGGDTWSIISQSEEIWFGYIVFIDSLRGWVTGGNPAGPLYHTMDGGFHWVLQHPGLQWENFLTLCFVDSLSGWALGEYGKIVYTENGGTTWLEQPRLTDGLTAMTFIDPAHGWVVGYNGKILHTAQGGLTKQGASPVSSQRKSALATSYQLYQNYPNPFNPMTTIRYNLPQNDKVTLKNYNLLGQEVKTFYNNDNQLAGQHHVIWDGCDNQGQVMASGIYFSVIKTECFVATKKMLLIR